VNKIIFFDFDGVIKESLDVKTNALVKLFEPFGNDIAERVRKHHLENGGMSRFDKFPVYLSWANTLSTANTVNSYCEQFSELVFQGVVDAEWVPGVKEYIEKKYGQQILIVVSATPQQEMENILDALEFKKYFTAVFGSPASKKVAIKESLFKYKATPEECLMIGDARADMEAAAYNNVPFLLRIHNTNKELFSQYTGEKITNFCNL
jgi:phosphoglycolate phosphatase-like HAD superfamily hydrolase